MGIIGLERTYRNLQRMRQIINVLIKHGFGHLIEQLNLTSLVSLGKRVLLFKKPGLEDAPSLTVPERLRLVLEELGPTFVKLGQLIASRPDLAPVEIAEEFKHLQDEVAPVPYEEIRQLIEEELGGAVGQVFAEFDPEPVAAASIAQVYRAKLVTGEDVILKVQRPGIETVIDNDLGILFYLAQLLEKYVPELRLYRPVDVVEEFARSIRRELDFVLEASNAERMRENFRGDKTVYIPKVYWEYTSRRLLTLERIEGIPIDEVERITAAGLDRKEIAVKGCRAFLRQVFEFGFFHADPHAGNILVRADGTLGFLDFGIMGRLDERHMTHIANVFFALINRDYERLVDEYLAFGVVDPEVDIDRFRNDMIDFIEPYYGQPLKRIPVSSVFTQGTRLMVKYRLKTQPDLLLLGKMLVFVEGIGRQLDEDFNLLEISRPYAAALLKKRFDPRRIFRGVSRNVAEFADLLKVMPRQVQLLLAKAVRGELEIGHAELGTKDLERVLRQSYNRLAFALVISALIIGSSMILQSDRGPYLFGYPALGVVGYCLAAVVGFWLLISMYMSRKG